MVGFFRQVFVMLIVGKYVRHGHGFILQIGIGSQLKFRLTLIVLSVVNVVVGRVFVFNIGLDDGLVLCLRSITV